MILKQTILADGDDGPGKDSPINKFRKIMEKSAIAMVVIVIMPIAYASVTGSDPAMDIGFSFGQGESSARLFKDAVWALQVVIVLSFFGSLTMKIQRRCAVNGH